MRSPLPPLLLRTHAHIKSTHRWQHFHHHHHLYPSSSPLSSICHRFLAASSSRRRPPPSIISSSSPSSSPSSSSLNHHSPQQQQQQQNGKQPSPSTGISYLDTWMGNTNKERRPGPAMATTASTPASSSTATAISPHRSPSSASDALFANNNLQGPNNTNYYASSATIPSASAHGNNNTASSSSSSFSCMQVNNANGLPSSSFQMYSLRPNKHDTAQTLLERLHRQLNHQHHQKQHQQTDSNDQKRNNNNSIVPIILDLSAFHPDGSPHFSYATQGTLTEYVNVIRAYNNSSNNATQQQQQHQQTTARMGNFCSRGWNFEI